MKQQSLNSEFGDLVRKHERIIYKICYMYADNTTQRQDLYQEIMLQLWRGYAGFRGESKFSTWLYQVALNTAIAGLRKTKRSVVDYTNTPLPDIAEQDTDTHRLETLHKAIEQLNPIEKAIIMLYLDDKSYDEMQDVTGISNGTLRVKMSRIKEKLRNITKN